MGDGYQEVQEVISIHAPTRGATSLKATEYKLSIDFNPRSHERSDNYIPDEFKSYIISIHAPTRGATMTSDETGMVAIFQSTLPREERHVLDIYIYDMCIFQSTLPREERRKKQSYNVRNRQFQSTLPREERPQHYLIFKPYARISIHAPTRGATKAMLLDINEIYISIHAPTRGATFSLVIFPPIKIFQSTLPREERQKTTYRKSEPL